MAIGFPARFAESRTFILSEGELVSVVESALRNLRWPYQIQWGREFHAQVPHGPWSWGETLKAEIVAGGRIQAQSKSSGRTPAIIDFGKSRKNVETFFAMVDHCINAGSYQEPASTPSPQTIAPSKQTSPVNRLAGSVLGGCVIATLVLATFTYFISAIIGLVTGHLYLPGRGHGGMVHGALARILAVVILLMFAWVVVWVLRQRRKRRQS
jgi:hypothetical protein